MSTAQRNMHISAQSVLEPSIVNQIGYMDAINYRKAMCIGTFRSNCLGTALYIAGVIANDDFVNPFVAKRAHLDALRPLDKPRVGSLVAWEHTYKMWLSETIISRLDSSPKDYKQMVFVCHMAVVSSLDPFLITHRVHTDGPFVECQQFVEIDQKYDKLCKALYYMPEGLARMLRTGPKADNAT